MHHPPAGPAFDIVLIAHVACVVVSLVTLVASATTAARLRRQLSDGDPLPEAVARYFRPGINWAGRSVYGIPVFGFLLIALGHGAYSLGDSWILGGLAVLIAMVWLTEGTLWPAERRLQVSLSGGPTVENPDRARDEVRRDARTMMLSAELGLVLVVLGSALMIAQP
jgi:hypothetical protein